MLAPRASATALIAVYNINLRRAVTARRPAAEAMEPMTAGFDRVLAGLAASAGPG